MSIRNIIKVWDRASITDRSEGMQWYERARSECDCVHFDDRTATALVAVLSPGLRWEVNVEAAKRLSRGELLHGLGVRWFANVVKAQKILKGQRPETVLGGNKVRAFWACLMNPSNKVHVCIDTHAYNIWTGKYVPSDKQVRITNARYRRASFDFIAASRKIGILPCQLQAVTWTTWRRQYVPVVEYRAA